MDKIKMNKSLMRRIVRSVEKAIAEDVPQYLREHHKETNNAIIQLRGDYINDNLRNMVVGENIELVPFKRYSWHGRILVDRIEKISYTITTKQTLHAVPKKHRNKPHFLQSILYMENSGYEAPIKQLTLMDIYPFEEEVLQNDFSSIVEGLIDPNEGYRHYVIVYDAVGSELIDIQLEFLDKDFDIIEAASLNEYIKPDFSRLTDVEPVDEDLNDEVVENAKGLLKVKSGLRPKLKDISKQA
ncbi:DUF5986 family protein [Kurthia gibsonii]|uniref:DUF5986 family protein n=1 Tax=Kurthia gibsonii TaxID=33946 RepID=UPI002DB9E732|nr:DUF5986 family protein [Kurthia gibsonii]MEB6113919.1 DUF5986 family protein [Kurthia gibsonii]